VVGQLGCGGLERQLCYLFEAMDRLRYHPELVVWNSSEMDIYSPAIQTLGIRLHHFARNESRTEKVLALRRLVREVNPELVHSFTFHTNLAVWWAVRGTRALAVGAVRSDFALAKRETGPLLGRLCARWPRQQIFNSRAAANKAARTSKVFVPCGLHLVRNAVDVRRFSYKPFVSSKPTRVLGVGSLVPIKRWERLFRAAALLKQAGYTFEIQLVGDGPLRGELQQQIHALGISDCVHLLGYRSDVAELMAAAHFLTHTSDSEGCPNVVAEAMASGRAVVATDTGDVSSLVEDGMTGFLVACEDELGLVEKMRILIAAPNICQRMGRAGRAKAEKELSLDRFIRETFAVYEKIGWHP
jgi:glycosyltransferase involved in cell wall biosynthesis